MNKKIMFFLVILAMPVSSITAQENSSRHIVTRTRLQVKFSELEDQWYKAAQQKDNATLDKLLSEEFHLWSATVLDPVPRDDWKKTAFQQKLKSYRISRLAARAVTPDVTVISYVLNATFEESGKPVDQDYFIVDTWTRAGSDDSWICTDRYQTPVREALEKKPDVKPDGKG
jgi:hypothetical protein